MEKDGEKIQLGIPEQMRQMASMLIPLGRPASPEEAAGGVFFLCSPWSNYVHGQTLHVTGGLFGGMTGWRRAGGRGRAAQVQQAAREVGARRRGEVGDERRQLVARRVASPARPRPP